MLSIKSVFWYLRQFVWLTNNLRETAKVKKLVTENPEEAEKRIWSDAESWAKYIVRSTGSTVKVVGEENLIKDRAVLVVSNHQGYFDIPVLMGNMGFPIGFVAKTDLEKFPFLSEWMKLIHCLFMDRDDMKQSLKIITEGIKQIKNGQSMVIFPEGTRNHGGPVAEFHAGSFKLATKAKAPIIPVTIDGSHRIMDRKWNIGKTEVILTIHKPIYTENLTKDEQADLHITVRETIAGALK
ncbi:MAG: 1-acyl-sn-glycerol-3-phosphate acyltransferase [Clostridiales bacterium]|nr:1-acyl-sn-glycerol-3-phosphate acyltransferase [Clostridiales bacterium]